MSSTCDSFIFVNCMLRLPRRPGPARALCIPAFCGIAHGPLGYVCVQEWDDPTMETTRVTVTIPASFTNGELTLVQASAYAALAGTRAPPASRYSTCWPPAPGQGGQPLGQLPPRNTRTTRGRSPVRPVPPRLTGCRSDPGVSGSTAFPAQPVVSQPQNLETRKVAQLSKKASRALRTLIMCHEFSGKSSPAVVRLAPPFDQ